MLSETKFRFAGENIPEWIFEFNGYQCPFLIIGYRMGKLAMEKLNLTKENSYEMFVFAEMGIAHPQIKMIDGVQAATGATYGKGQLFKLNYGKPAVTFYFPNKGAVRIHIKNEFLDRIGKFEYMKYRKQGIKNTEIPSYLAEEILNFAADSSIEEIFNMKEVADFAFKPIKISFEKAKCEICGEYTYERYLRNRSGKLVCIPCSEYDKEEDKIKLHN
ncbi:MAG: FmdE family protein [Ignavibacteriaceae bacterium]